MVPAYIFLRSFLDGSVVLDKSCIPNHPTLRRPPSIRGVNLQHNLLCQDKRPQQQNIIQIYKRKWTP